MYGDCIAPSKNSDSWASMDSVSEPRVRRTSFRAMLKFVQIINQCLENASRVKILVRVHLLSLECPNSRDIGMGSSILTRICQESKYWHGFIYSY